MRLRMYYFLFINVVNFLQSKPSNICNLQSFILVPVYLVLQLGIHLWSGIIYTVLRNESQCIGFVEYEL